MSTRFDVADPLLYADMREALHLGAEVLYDSADGLLLKHNGKLFAAGEAVERLPRLRGCGMVLLHDGKMAARLMQEGCFTECMEVMQLVYTDKSVTIPPCEASIRRLTLADLDFVLQAYHHPNTREAYIRARIESLMLGAFVDSAPAGCIGVHAEGAMGLLEVLPRYRRRGIGRFLQASLMQMLLEKGSTPYCHVAPDNATSLALQHTLGLRAAEQHVYWLYKPAELCF
ncbi:MAG: GNAT family N-acetyltransferase [Clostridia bacterium]|nr:GNAT family N-acetyltransferase [Clostridia bacterium]